MLCLPRRQIALSGNTSSSCSRGGANIIEIQLVKLCYAGYVGEEESSTLLYLISEASILGF